MYFFPSSIEIVFQEGPWYNTCEYSISMVADKIYPDIDLTFYLAEHALKISRKQAWLTEINGSWFLSLDVNAKSPVYLKDIGRLMAGQEYEILDEIQLGFGGPPNYAYLYMTVRIVKE